MLNISFPTVRVLFSDSGLACAAGSLSIEMPFLALRRAYPGAAPPAVSRRRVSPARMRERRNTPHSP
jgi:hypothetical protein